MRPRLLLALLVVLIAIAGCRKTPAPETVAPPPAVPAVQAPIEPDQSEPVGVVEAVLEAARSQDYSRLGGLCDPQGKNDTFTSDICALASDQSGSDLFLDAFAVGKVKGEPTLSPDGMVAQVPILYGPDGDEMATMVLVQRERKWYLHRLLAAEAE